MVNKAGKDAIKAMLVAALFGDVERNYECFSKIF